MDNDRICHGNKNTNNHITYLHKNNINAVTQTLSAGRHKKPPVIWLGTNTCAGDMLSLLNTLDPTYQSFISDMIDLRYDYLGGGSEGNSSMAILEETQRSCKGQYILIVEGSIPLASEGRYSIIGYRQGKPWTALDAVRELSVNARYVVAAGTCAAFGGIYAAAPNLSQSVSLQAVLDRQVINVPGCPINPEWMVGTLAYLVKGEVPALDNYQRPKLFFGNTVHDRCQRRSYFDNSLFAKTHGEPWCMYEIGCKGPSTYADCPDRQWNGEHVNWPVKANTPCIGCTSPEFIDGDVPFFEHSPDVKLPGIKLTANRFGIFTGAATAIGIGSHLAGSVLTGRLAQTIRDDFPRRKKTKALLRAIKAMRLGKHKKGKK
ncbi:hydrogenase small subunit [Dehalobacter sp. DCM]|uniref:hydrogenase small subunit n=1 Tax=Dehalobacter sp. DCM TaxID=2907827 RepID=UPI00308191C1|nr:hydrogenase small subunit [Dehalobacter sp. DCM]